MQAVARDRVDGGSAVGAVHFVQGSIVNIGAVGMQLAKPRFLLLERSVSLVEIAQHTKEEAEDIVQQWEPLQKYGPHQGPARTMLRMPKIMGTDTSKTRSQSPLF